MNCYRITILPGDGIGPEITTQAVRVLTATAKQFGFELEYSQALMGGAAIDQYGQPLPASTLQQCRESDAVLLGAVGGPQWDGLSGNQRPEAGLLALRAGLGLYANLRPSRTFSALEHRSPLKSDRISGFNLMIVRELTGGIYFGERGRTNKDGHAVAFDTEEYSQPEIERIARMAFEVARGRKNRLTSVDKANVLESSRLWRETVTHVGAAYPDVTLNHLYVDNAAMQLVLSPGQFDVIVTSNMFGDILSDEASVLGGSIGLLPSASVGRGGPGLFEPVHGSAPDIAGRNRANPLATILSAAMLLRMSLDQPEAAVAVEDAVEKALDIGRTADIASEELPILSTSQMGNLVLECLSS